ncbi:MAG TPA: glycosyltransferase family 4 protein [Gemmatimonadales bacterium]|nr:glycosyltransferase family 4 protein [Gemmatimonadales bacterium]
MPPTRYDVHLATALDPATLRATPLTTRRIHHASKAYSYVDQMQRRSRSRTSGLPALLRRPAGWLDFGVRLVRNTGYTKLLSRWIRRDGIALVHLNNGFENLEAHLAAWFTGRPIVVHAHGPCGSARLTRRLAARGPVCIAISDVVGRSLIEAGVPRDRVHVLPNPLTLDPLPLDATLRHSARRELGIPERFRLMGIVGRIVEWKGQREFLNAAAVAMKSDPHLGAVIIGDVTDAMDEYGNQVRQQATDLGIADRVWFSGFMPDPRRLYALADVVVHSSILPEPFGLVITEAMALGIPVVAANAGGPVEIITDGVDGFLVDPCDAAAVAGRVAALFADPALYQRIGAAGRQTALERFSPEAYVERVARVYDAALAGPGGR